MPQRPETPQHTLCPQCHHRIVQAVTSEGRPIALDTGLRTYRLVLAADNQTYRAVADGAYPAHACHGKEDTP